MLSRSNESVRSQFIQCPQVSVLSAPRAARKGPRGPEHSRERQGVRNLHSVMTVKSCSRFQAPPVSRLVHKDYHDHDKWSPGATYQLYNSVLARPSSTSLFRQQKNPNTIRQLDRSLKRSAKELPKGPLVT